MHIDPIIAMTLVGVYNDLLTAVDVGQEAISILLNYSAAFDTINHEKFFQLLSSKFGIMDVH